MKSCSEKCRCHRKKSCHVTTLLVGLTLGGMYGMLFTKTAGADLRKKLKKSKTPCKDFFRAGMQMDMDFFRWCLQRIKNLLD